ncbi:hypothetical protein [Dactylosporangium sp. NPDC000521]|uniref:hypothetical protein n=1 Tax=Dactylosporangium sp. NPDC000521 TaxID=3363975 RepID=UPI0036846D4B
MAETLIAAGGDACSDGLRMPGWLLERETYDGHLSCMPVGHAGPLDAAPGFDQQPIEAAAMADACARAMTVSTDPRWERGLASAIDWFLGANDRGLPLHDPSTGGGCDGLTASGRNENQAASRRSRCCRCCSTRSGWSPPPRPRSLATDRDPAAGWARAPPSTNERRSRWRADPRTKEDRRKEGRTLKEKRAAKKAKRTAETNSPIPPVGR